MIRIFDGLYVDQLFQKNERGETIFYPFGLMGSGYRLPPEREAGVRSATRLLMFISLVVGFGFAFAVLGAVEGEAAAEPIHMIIGGGAFLVVLGLIAAWQSRLAAGLEPVTERVAAGEWLRRGRQARATWTYRASIGLGAMSLLLAVGGFALGLADGDMAGFAAGVFFLLVGGLLAWDGVMGLRERARAAKAG